LIGIEHLHIGSSQGPCAALTCVTREKFKVDGRACQLFIEKFLEDSKPAN